MHPSFYSLLVVVFTLGCGSDGGDADAESRSYGGGPVDPGGDKLCEESLDPVVVLGVEGADGFRPREAGEALRIEMSPQGGFNFQLQARAKGVRASPERPLSIRAKLTVDAVTSHDQSRDLISYECTEQEGMVIDTHIGANLEVVRTAEQVVRYNNAEGTLSISITNANGATASDEAQVRLEL